MPTPMIDTHCHLDVPAFADDVAGVVARATSAGVIGMLVPAIRPSMWPALGQLVEEHRAAGMRLAIGVHPQIVPELGPDEIGSIESTSGIERDTARDDTSGIGRRDAMNAIDAIASWIAREAIAYRAIAIGECGLDGSTGDLPRQEVLFRAHIRAARMTGLPLVIHVLRAHDLAPRILREELARPPRVLREDSMPPWHGEANEELASVAARHGEANEELASMAARHEGPPREPRVLGVLHSYSGGADLVDVYRGLGLAFSFAGPVTYANARKPVEAARLVPDHLLLAETDAPDQAPEGHRGGRSEPAFVAAVIQGLAAARGQAAEEVAALTTANAQRIFRSWE